MKTLQMPIFALLFLLAGCDPSVKDYKKTMAKKGLPAKVTVRVCDPLGNPVPDATVKFVFGFYNKNDLNIVAGRTDDDGMAAGEGLGNDKIAIHVGKGGYYETFFYHSVWGAGKDSYKTGRWEPWNPTLGVTLYPRLNPPRPIPKMRSYYSEHLEQDTAYGFDMLKKDIILPDKKGEVADFSFKGNGYKIIMPGENPRSVKIFFTNDLEVAFQNEGDGVIRMKKLLDSKFHFTYLAPETGYAQRLHFYEDYSPRRPEGKGDLFPTDNEYFIFRISRKDDESGEMKKYYGIIIRLWGTATRKDERTFDIEYYLNPTPGDRNIEYGP